MGHLVRNCWCGIAYHPYIDPDKKWIVQWVGSPETSTSSKPPASSRDAEHARGRKSGWSSRVKVVSWLLAIMGLLLVLLTVYTSPTTTSRTARLTTRFGSWVARLFSGRRTTTMARRSAPAPGARLYLTPNGTVSLSQRERAYGLATPTSTAHTPLVKIAPSRS